jgi:2-C-methyl-D-erythritol 4-phosphate cytidylyltransferase
MMSHSVFAIIVAGGQGSRMGTALHKQFLDLEGKPVLYHTVQTFIEAVPGVQITLVLPADQISYGQMVLRHIPNGLDLTIVAGGPTRYQSVQAGLAAISPADTDIIMIHDGVRPLVTPSLIQACIDQAVVHGSAIPAVTLSDSVRTVSSTGSIAVSREKLRFVQTPQTFRASVLLPAMQQPWQVDFTDEATAVEALGTVIHLIPGERRNIKITTPEDMIIAAAFMQSSGI